MNKEALRTELFKFTETLLKGYQDDSTILEILGTNDVVDNYIDFELKERWKSTPERKIDTSVLPRQMRKYINLDTDELASYEDQEEAVLFIADLGSIAKYAIKKAGINPSMLVAGGFNIEYQGQTLLYVISDCLKAGFHLNKQNKFICIMEISYNYDYVYSLIYPILVELEKLGYIEL